ncbi:XPO1, CRM1, exportin-1 [Babesia microti strain RI]|uniref:Exportin-1 n=1 Tax=Babesia microti (strain RI) TaxID=1133968 RepID=I7J938_BABMR|nr:XPO1, CRM1, exportin-1 [Babesia microti strain RI]CCF73159.1 XPO1, CRM1, exportin-1 [Babesia microti strain RI]|eukprot:XP_012647768.1 XPO1, CRM1, exportin-1 [Babesia microti strain RI]
MDTPTSCDPRVLLDCKTLYDSSKVALLDSVVDAMFGNCNTTSRDAAHKILGELKSLPDAWRNVAVILSTSRNTNTKFLALQILESCIGTRWNILPEQERAGIKQYVSELVINMAMEEKTWVEEKHLLTKANENLIQIAKREWPEKWPTFISEICKSSHASQIICENNMHILNMLSEEVFDFGQEQITSTRVATLMNRMASEFCTVFDLCLFVLVGASKNPEVLKQSLIKQTLTCLAHFIKWIPLGYIFEPYNHQGIPVSILDLLLNNFWEPLFFRIECTKCFSEVANLDLHQNEVQMFSNRLISFWTQLVNKFALLPPNSTNYDNTSYVSPQMRMFWETFYLQFALLTTNFLKRYHQDIVTATRDKQSILLVLERLIRVTEANHEETFKITLDYWHHLTKMFLMPEQRKSLGIAGENDPTAESFSDYRLLLVAVQKVFINKMAKPQEIYIMYDSESGEVTREYDQNTAEITLYNRMKQTLIGLTTLLQDDTERLMLEVLDREMAMAQGVSHSKNNEDWDSTALNRLCYSVGAISGAMDEGVEKRFLVQVIKSLLNICEVKTSTSHKAIVASNIMYVVGQYPRFLKANWRFLHTVLNKLFEFVRETFPGVQQMACETFLKLSLTCGKVIVSSCGNTEPYLTVLLNNRDMVASYLDDKLLLIYYEAVGNVISAASPDIQPGLIQKLLESCNVQWQQVLRAIQSDNCDALSCTRAAFFFLRANTRIAKTTGSAFTCQLGSIFPAMMNLYSCLSLQISKQVAEQGLSCIKNTLIVAKNQTKRAVLHLIETFVSNVSPPKDPSTVQVINTIFDSCITYVFVDYQKSHPDLRDPDVLTLAECFVTNVDCNLCQIFDTMFECTLNMVKQDFHSYPDHRENFYNLLGKSVQHRFSGITCLLPSAQSTLLKSLIWAFRHEHPTLSDKGLKITYNFLRGMGLGLDQPPTEYMLEFCREHYYMLLDEVLSVLTDTLHRSGFKTQTEILRLLIGAIESGKLHLPQAGLEKIQVMRHLVEIITRAFATINVTQAEAFILDIFNYSIITDKTHSDALEVVTSKFQITIQDLLLSIKEYSEQSNETHALHRDQAVARSRHM